MSTGISWRSPATADQYRDHDYADFAQEFLQRNAAYRRDFAETQDRIAGDPATAPVEEEGLAGRWGLSFPHCSGRRPARLSGAVVAESRTRRGRGRDSRHSRDPASAWL
ncbi:MULTISPECIES: DUF6499 domain-containing protein [unclassified Novosphingobium]|uniref:transcriptional regulator domain-containing protein n=1 Tax=unclassified Novosphingobium TaxID=2644732 RepID=UPI0025EA1827|nr:MULTISPECIES: DUF6499 domain-containing protein [unclassified Novosphingobium]HQV01880.1 DUF6499 domain-containing protein [Novosphingobium sp.]